MSELDNRLAYDTQQSAFLVRNVATEMAGEMGRDPLRNVRLPRAETYLALRRALYNLEQNLTELATQEGDLRLLAVLGYNNSDIRAEERSISNQDVSFGTRDSLFEKGHA